MVTRSAAPPPHPPQVVWEAPPFCCVGCGGVVGCCGWESPFLLPPVVWGLVGGKGFPPSPPVVWGSGGWESQSLPPVVWGLVVLLGTIQYRAIKSVLMTSMPPIIDYTLCHILYTIYSRVYTIYYRLYSVYMVYLYTTARPLKGGNQVFHTSLGAMWEPDYSILQYSVLYYSVL